MAANVPDPNNPSPQPGPLQSMLARLKGMYQSLRSTAVEKAEELRSTWETPAAPPAMAPEPGPEPAKPPEEPPAASPVLVAPAPATVVTPEPGIPAEEPAPASSVAEPVTDIVPVAESVEAAEPVPSPVAEAVVPEPVTAAKEEPLVAVALAEPEPVAAAAEPPSAAPVPVPQNCPHCQAPRNATMTYCEDCGLIYPAASNSPVPLAVSAVPAAEAVPVAMAVPVGFVKNRYQLAESIGEREGVTRFRGRDFGAGGLEPAPIIVVRAKAGVAPDPVQVAEKAEAVPEWVGADDEILPGFDFPLTTPDTKAPVVSTGPAWPSIAWEKALLDKAVHSSLPRLIDHFTEDGWEFLVEEVPTGQVLWDAWDDSGSGSAKRYAWLKQVAEGLHRLHKAGAMLEGIRPDIIVVTKSGQAMFSDLSDLLPLPLPAHAPIRGSLYSAPELVAAAETVDARADLYSFGAMLYALHLGRELTENDFEKKRPGVPKPFLPHFPDIHPLFGRLISKTFAKDPGERFPTDEAGKEDPTGFTELIRVLDICRRTMDNIRLDIASWTTTGIVRTGNEDAFGLLHAVESRQDDLHEYAVILLADGMGGYEAGEVAAALAVQSLRKYLLGQRLFAALAGGPPPAPGEFTVESCKQVLHAALKDANSTVYNAARQGIGRRGMGCTAEAVYVDGQHVVVGHVGDSRTYHLHEGRIVQLTRDQTLVNRLVELGQLTEEEAETHPRRSELQQAIGGRSDVQPELYSGHLKPGDWVLICSDGLSNHIKTDELKEMLQSEATSAEMAARRLVNLANLRGATDNATVVVIRAT